MITPSSPRSGSVGLDTLRTRFGERTAASSAYFGEAAAAIAACASAMADRFFDGGTLLVIGAGRGATDAQHNSVEYVHPVLPGCRALPALSLASDTAAVTGMLTGADPGAVFARQIEVLARPEDIVLALGGLRPPPAIARGLAAARERSLLTVALTAAPTGDADLAGTGVDHELRVPSDDPLVVQELHLATYHILWELVHIVLNHRGIAARSPR